MQDKGELLSPVKDEKLQEVLLKSTIIIVLLLEVKP